MKDLAVPKLADADVAAYMRSVGEAARTAARELARADTHAKNRALEGIATAIRNAGSALLEGVLVGRGAVIGAGVTLTGSSRLYDLVRDRVLQGTADAPLVVPPDAVVVPGTRTLPGLFAGEHGLSVSVALLVKDRDSGTSARVALEEALR